jgi:hypothetical protein
VAGLFLVKGSIFYGLARLTGRPPSVALAHTIQHVGIGGRPCIQSLERR